MLHRPFAMPIRPSRLALLFVACLGFVGCLPPPVRTDEPTECPADVFEPNNSAASAFVLKDMRDHPDTKQTLTSSVHRGLDADWYRVHVDDTGAGGNPNVTAAVSEGFDVSTWFVCDDSSSWVECTVGSGDNERVVGVDGCRGTTAMSDERIDGPGTVVRSTTECSGSTDSGMLYVRVERKAKVSACTYALTITVD